MKITKNQIKLIFLGWFCFGFLIGAMDTVDERTSGKYIPNSRGGLDYISNNRTGCVYKSLASLASPGYIFGCEIFRKRFEIGK